MTKLVGLTGGIASGKSLITNYVTTLGIPVIDADKITHELQEPNSQANALIAAEFGETVIDDEGALNRANLGAIVFSDAAKLKTLVRIMNPLIRERVVAEYNQLKADHELVIFDAPTLFENSFTDLVDQIVVVYVDAVTQMERLINRNDLSIAQANQRIKSQWLLETKVTLADVVINNSESKSQTLKQVDEWLNNF